MEDKNTPWQPGKKQDAPKAAKKTSAPKEKKEKAVSQTGLNADGNEIGGRVTFEQIIEGMKKQKQPLIERSNKRRR